MGTYYIAVNHDKSEYIDGNDIKEGGVKLGPMIHGRMASLLMFKLMLGTSKWESLSIIGDYSDDYDTVLELYTNVTEATIEDYNNVYPEEPLTYEPMEEDPPGIFDLKDDSDSDFGDDTGDEP